MEDDYPTKREPLDAILSYVKARERRLLIVVWTSVILTLLGALFTLNTFRPRTGPEPDEAPAERTAAQLPPPVPVPVQTAPPQPERRLPAAWPIKYAIRIEGHDIAADAAYVLNVLEAAGELKTREAALQTSDGVCELFIQELKFPGKCASGLKALAGALNEPAGTIDRRPLGSSVKVPRDMIFKEDPYYERYDPENRFDKERMADHLRRRATYVMSQTDARGGMKRVEYAGFRLELLRSTELPESVVQTLVKSKRNIYLTRVEPSGAPPERFYASASEADDFYNRWCQSVTGAEEFAYARLLGGKDDFDPACDSGENCANVVLLDKDLYKNPEIMGSFPPAYKAASDEHVGDLALKCLAQIDDAKHHGTFLAGLIASARNKAGFWGVHPSALLYPVTWASRQADAVARTLRDRDELQTRKQIYVFAGHWEPEQPHYYAGFFLHDEDHRFSPPMARELKGMGGLWIVAAGQEKDANGRPLQIEKRLKFGPMNLGDQRNVLVVTGCDSCGTDATLWSKANYAAPNGLKMVHVAARATNVPGIANNKQYAKIEGTSPATALVAGLASAFIAQYGRHFQKPQWLKQWLQYTSTPSLREPDAQRVATGVVNAEMAIKDPTKSWLDTTAPGWSELREVRILGWCEPEAFTMGRWDGDDFRLLPHYPHVRVRDLFRIVRDTRTGTRATRWFVYSEYPGLDDERLPGEVLRIGPATSAEADKPLFKLQSGLVKFGDIEDLLVTRLGVRPPKIRCR